MVRGFLKSANQPNEIALTICNPISCYCFRLMIGWNWKVYQMVRKFPSSRSEWKKRSTFEGTPQFPNGISGKLPYHLTSNRSFRIFWLNGKHPWSWYGSERPYFFFYKRGGSMHILGLLRHFLWVGLRNLDMDEMSLVVWNSTWASFVQMKRDTFSYKGNLILFFARSKFN